MTTTENNAAAQAGDEPMDYAEQLRAAVETVCEGWTLPPGARKTLETALWAPQVSPRATADVEREDAIALLGELLTLEAQENIARSDGNGEGITTKRFDSLTGRVAQFLATTKPGA